ncbi:MAG: MFS transporter [Nostoc sp.]|uniref:MFS transporter n=1 Tax=Nostoc sp. TaxID=1180 RepID=UPI002FF3FA18
MAQRTSPSGMVVFTLIWFGQLISVIGSGLTGFALGVWVYQLNGSVTQFTLISLCTTLPGIIISPLAGAIVDRWNRRWVMLASDCGAGLSTLAVALLFFTNHLELWHICIAMTLSSLCNAFQWPAYSTTPTLLVAKQHFGRANGMIEFGDAAAQLISPILGGLLVSSIHLQGVLLIDFVTFVFSIATLLVVRIPQPKPTAASEIVKGSLWQEVAYGWTYIRVRPGLLGLLLLSTVTRFLMASVHILATPLVLAFADPTTLGTVLSIGGSGMVIGSLVMSIWGVQTRRIQVMFSFQMLSGLCILAAGLRRSIPLLTLSAFIYFFCAPLINGCIRTIWQSKVAPDVQGRVFGVERMIGWSSLPLSYLVAGSLSDRIFEPLLTVNGPLAGSIGQIIGVGPGRGIALLFIIIGILVMLNAIVGYLHPRIRFVEDELPNIKTSFRRNAS